MKVTLVGSRFFGAEVLKLLREEKVEILAVAAPKPDDRLAKHAVEAGLKLVIPADERNIAVTELPDDADLIIGAHAHARIPMESVAKARIGGVGYHPSLLPRHRGIAAIEWTVKLGDPIAGGSIYHMADRMDAGAIAFQDWCFVLPGEDARSLWERALAPMGLDLMRKTIRHAREHGSLPAHVQDDRFATKAPMKGL